MNIPFSFGYGTPQKYQCNKPQKYLCNKPQRIAHEWERKTCKTCAFYYNSRCDFCHEKFGSFRIKATHAACNIYKPKSK